MSSYCQDELNNISNLTDIFQVDGNISLLTESVNISEVIDEPSPIPVHISSQRSNISVIVNQFYRRQYPAVARTPCRVTIRRSNRILEATQLPVIMLLNPRSIYNKLEEFRTMMEQMEVDICAISESWDRENLPIENILQMEGYKIIKNVVQRNKKGGKPILVLKEEKFHIKQLCPDVITVPIGIEAVWALVTPKNVTKNCKVKNIIVASVYYTKATKRSEFIDHICESFSVLSAKYGPNLHFAICGDLNRLNIKPI